MKKFTKTLAVSLAVSLIGAAVAGCGSSKKDTKIEGKYTAEWDATDSMLDRMDMNIRTDKSITVIYTLKLDDGEYTISYDTDAMEDELTDFFMDEDVRDALMDELGFNEYSASQLEELAEYRGYDDFDEMWEEEMVGQILAQMGGRDSGETGTYEIDGDTITFTDDDDDSFEGEIDGGDIIIYVEKLDAELVFSK